MSKVSLTGKWLVKSVYGKSYGQDHGSTNLWELDAIDIEGEFTGIGKDISNFCMSEELTKVIGFFDNNLLRFSRKYQHTIISYTDRTSVTVKDTPYEVNYEGSFNEFLECFQGTWILHTTQNTRLAEGTFEMKIKPE